MARQTAVNNFGAVPFAIGLPREDSGLCVHRKAGGMAKKQVDITVTAADSFAYTVTLPTRDGSTKTVGSTSGAGATTDGVRDLLIDDINEDGDIVAYAIIKDADEFSIIFDEPGYDGTVSLSANLAQATATAADAGDTIAFGMGVCQSSDEDFCELPTLTAAVAEIIHATPATPNASDTIHFTVAIEGTDGEFTVYTDIPVTPGATVALTADAIVTAFDGLITGLTVTDGTTHAIFTGPSDGRSIKVTARVTGGNGTTCPVAINTEGTKKKLTRPFLGVARYYEHQRANSSEEHVYQPGDSLKVHKRGGPIPVPLVSGQNPSESDPVYLVCAGADHGKFTTADGANNVRITSASWGHGGARTALAGELGCLLELNKAA